MSSPSNDHYAGLMTPWKPIAVLTTKDGNSLRNRMDVDHGTQEGDKAEMDSNGSGISYDNRTLSGDVDISDTDSIEANNVANGAQEVSNLGNPRAADIIDTTNIDSSIGDGAQIGGADIIDTNNDPPQHIDIKCMAVSTCVANSGDHRKVVSHIFGRNKACTRKLPKNLWILWCRKHYQRFKYRAEDAENWHTIQLGLVRNQLQTFEDWGGVRCWTISLRKAEQDALAKEKQNLVAHTNHVSVCWERFLLPYLGVNKTFAHVRQVLEVIDGKFNEAEYRKRDKKLKMFPGVEFLPVIQKAKEDQKPAAKKGEITYKKITLDQPAFNRKNRANTEYIKEMAAKKREASNTPKSSGTPCEKENYPEIDNDAGASTTIKRETSITDNATDDPAGTKSKPVDISTTIQKALPTKRRRLTRGYEKHGSDGEETTAIEKEGREGEE